MVIFNRLAYLWTLLTLGVVLICLFHFYKGVEWDSHLLALLPTDERDPALEALMKQVGDEKAKQVVWVVRHAEEAVARRFAKRLVSELETSGDFEFAQIPSESGPAVFEYYLPYRYQLLSPETRDALRYPDGVKKLLKENERFLYSPVSGFLPLPLEKDPLLLLPRWLRSLAPRVAFEGRRSQEPGVIVIAKMRDHPYVVGTQRKILRELTTTVDRIRRENSAFAAATVKFTGVLRFAAAGVEGMKHQISWMTWYSLGAIFLFLILVFRSLTPFLLTTLTLAIGALFALTGCLLIFDRIHLFTLAFGTTLLGVAVDYSLHYFAERERSEEGWDARQGMRHLLPTLSLACVTSVLAYVGLSMAPFPGLYQIAVFSSFGLLGALGSVICWYPFLLRKPAVRKNAKLLRIADFYLRLWNPSLARRRVFVCLGLAIIGMFGILHLRADDDIRRLQRLPPLLVQEHQAIMEFIGGYDEGRFILVEGKSEQELLEREESLAITLQALRNEHALTDYRLLSQALPSLRQQYEDHRLLQTAFSQDQTWRKGLEEIGFRTPQITDVAHALERPIREGLTPDAWLTQGWSAPWSGLWLGANERGLATFVLLKGLANEQHLKERLAGLKGVLYINQVQALSSLFQRYRRHISILIALSYLGILLILWGRYGLSQGTWVMFPPMLAAYLTLGMLGYLGEKITLFHVLSLLLVLGLGVDYSIFFADSTHDAKHRRRAMVSVLLCSITTLCSFGFLCFSSVPVLQSMGVTIVTGLFLCAALSPLPGWGRRKHAANS